MVALDFSVIPKSGSHVDLKPPGKLFLLSIQLPLCLTDFV